MFGINKLELPTGKYIVCDPKLVLSDFDFKHFISNFIDKQYNSKKPFIYSGFYSAVFYTHENNSLCKVNNSVYIPIKSGTIAAIPFGLCDMVKLNEALNKENGFVISSDKKIKCYQKNNLLIFGKIKIDIKCLDKKTDNSYSIYIKSNPYKQEFNYNKTYYKY